MTSTLISWPRNSAIAVLVASLMSAPAFASAESTGAADSCPVTRPSHWPAMPPWADGDDSERGWYGSTSLAAFIPNDGVWVGMGPERNYGDKFWWWRSGYDAQEETRPDLSISAVRLDAPAPPVEINDATNAFGDGWDAMLIGMEFPTSGCWEIRGTYKGAQELILVFQVVDE